MSKLPMRKCRGCGEMFQPVNQKQQFCTNQCRKAWEQKETTAICHVCLEEYIVKNITKYKSDLSGRKPMCNSCCASGALFGQQQQDYMRTCHTPGCNNRTTQYWCSKCRHERKIKYSGCEDFTGNRPHLERSFSL